MTIHPTTIAGVWISIALASAMSSVQRQTRETFSATAIVATAGGAKATAPLTVVIDRKMSQAEADALARAFKANGAAGLRKALEGVAPTGSIRLGKAIPVLARLTIERPTEKGRLLTIVSDTPIVFLGAGLPGARPKADYGFAVLDLEVDNSGAGSGTLAPAARIALKGDAFVVEDYGSELVRVTSVRAIK